MPNWKKVIVSGSNAILNNITASGNVSGSAISTASFGTYIGDGSQLSGISTTPFPFTGDAQISGSLIVSQSYTAGDTDSTALRLIGSGSVSQSGIFEVEGSAGPLFSVADGLDGILMEVNNISGLPLFQVSSSNEVFINRGNLTSGVTTATASFANFSGSFQGDGSNLTNLNTTTPTLQQVITAGAQANGDVVITGSLVISGSFDAFKLETDNIILGPSANNIQAGADNSVIIGHANVQSAYSGDRNVIVGDNSAIALTSGDENVIIGAESGVQLQANNYNIAIGSNTLNNVRGSGNIALGFRSMQYHDGASGYTQTNNVAIGIYSLRYGRNNSNYNVALGAYSLTGTGNTANQYNIGIGSFAGTNITSGEYNILIGPGIASDLTTQDKQLRIGSGSITTISASLATGDVTFYNTASAPNFSGSFQGNGSQLTNVTANTSSFALTSSLVIQQDATNKVVNTRNINFTGNAVALTTAAPNPGASVIVAINTGSSAAFPFTGDAQITGSFLVVAANSATAPTTSSLKIDSNGYFYHLGRYVGNSTAFANNQSNTVIGNNITSDGDYYNTIIGESAGVGSTTNQTAIGRGAIANVASSTAIGSTSKAYGVKSTSIGQGAGSTTSKGLNIGYNARGTGAKNIVLNASEGTAGPTKANTFGIYMTGASPNFEIEATGSSTLSGSSFTIEKSGSTVFEVIGSEGTLFSVDDDLDGVIFTANDRSGLPVLEASASGEVYIGKAPQSLYTTAVISSTTANISQSIYGLSTSSYGGVFVDYTANSGSNARAGSIVSVWNGSSLNFTETTTLDIGNTSNLLMQVAISQSQAQVQSYATTAGYNIKTIIRSI